MMMYFLKKNDSLKTWTSLINMAILFYLFRAAIPFFKFPFILLFSFLLVYSILKFHKTILQCFKDFLGTYFLVLFLALLLITSFLLSNKLYLTIFKDIFNIAVLLLVFFILKFFVNKTKDFTYFANNLSFQLVLFSIIISINVILNVLNIIPVNSISSYYGIISNSNNTSFEIDNNFGILPVLLGTIAIFDILSKTNSFWHKFLLNMVLLIFSISILFSGSRRGLILLIALIILLIIAQLYGFSKADSSFKTIGFRTRGYLISFFALALLICCFTLFCTNSSKNQTLITIGSNNVLDTKRKITNITSRYISMINKSLSYGELYNLIWTPVFNPNDPESSWGTRNHKNIFPLTGENVEIVPPNARGYLLDSTCNCNSEASTYCDAYSLVANLEVKKGERYIASVYCFASGDFNGDIVRFGVGTEVINKKNVVNNPISYYDLKKVDVWKKMEVDFECNTSGTVPIYLSLVKYNVKSFSSLKGYVIFAHPDFKKIERTDSVISDSNISLRKGDMGHLSFNNDFVRFDPEIVSINFPDKKKLESANKEPFENSKYSLSGLFNFQLPKMNLPDSIIADKDPLRNIVARFISEDTVYTTFSKNLGVDKISYEFTESRIMRWQFGWKIFTREYNLKQKLIGAGFKHLNWYGNYFLNDKKASDWPHNPFLSILLYSGIFGLSLYCFFLYKVVYLYNKYKREYPLLFIFFIITFFFSFFSGGSPFDPPIMGFFSILPFFIHSVHKRADKISNLSK
jgi:hypothetical protein